MFQDQLGTLNLRLRRNNAFFCRPDGEIGAALHSLQSAGGCVGVARTCFQWELTSIETAVCHRFCSYFTCTEFLDTVRQGIDRQSGAAAHRDAFDLPLNLLLTTLTYTHELCDHDRKNKVANTSGQKWVSLAVWRGFPFAIVINLSHSRGMVG